MAYVSVHVELEEFDDDELIEELESRGYKVLKDQNYIGELLYD